MIQVLVTELSARQNIVVIADEPHRSQYGFCGTVNEKTGEMSYGFANKLGRNARKLLSIDAEFEEIRALPEPPPWPSDKAPSAQLCLQLILPYANTRRTQNRPCPDP